MDHDAGSAADPSASFGPLHVVEPRDEHSQTAILVHGLGSTGEEFAEELFESNVARGTSLRDEFPGCRWVFPSSKELWSSTFEEYSPAWFEARSLTDPTARQDLQVPGIKESVAYLRGVLDAEVGRLGGRPEKVILGGISQGGAMAMWTLLCSPRAHERGLCAFVVASTWLPFATDIASILSKPANSHSFSTPPSQSAEGDFRDFVEAMVAPAKDVLRRADCPHPLLRTPVFIGHGSDDAYVDIELGREAARVLSSIGFDVEWKEYSGAEQEGHWLKVPEEMDDIQAFLAGAIAKSY